jgi:hypothetical protein
MFSRQSLDDEKLVASALRELANAPLEQTPLPDPSFIWWKAQLLRRREAEREATAPIEVGERVHIGAAILGAAALAVGAWDHVPALVSTSAVGLTIVAGAVVLVSVLAVAALQLMRER